MRYVEVVAGHLDRLIAAIHDPAEPMWPSVVDVRTGRQVETEHVPRRVYRLIGAPRGSTLYWDQPLAVAACELSRLTGQPRYAQAARDYVRAFVSRCVADTGMFRWGNHQYYDVFEKRCIDFCNGYHELRPITPAWDLFWHEAPERTADYLRAMGRRHVYDPRTGGFNRHDDQRREHAFLESGGIYAESLAWLFSKTGDKEALDLGLRIARYSFSHRHPATGLVPNEPDLGRWDAKVSTTEVGLWAQCLLRSATYTGRDEWIDMAKEATAAYLRYGYDEAAGQYFGQLSLETGQPVVADKPGYWPRRHASAWSTDQWPTHDYPMALAEACLTLWRRTGEDTFKQGAHRLAQAAMTTSPGRTGQWAYAESYGRCIAFLTRAGQVLGQARCIDDARLLASEAVDQLYEHGMLKGYADGHLYESVDGVGYLCLALLRLETGEDLDLHGFGF